MSTNHHTPHTFGDPLTAAELNSPLGQLDAAIATVITTGSGASTSLTAQANAGQATLLVASSAGFLVGDPIYIGTGATFESRIIATVPGGGVSLTVTVNLTNTYAIGKPVSKSPVEVVDARAGQTTLKGRLDQLAMGLFNVKAYGAIGNDTADDTAAIQAAITAAFNAPGGVVIFPAGTYKVTSTLVTPADTAGAVALVGMGRPRSFTAGNSGDPVANQGVTIHYTGTTGDIFLASVSTSNKRQYITIQGIYFQGNVAGGTTGHGLHFLATIATVAILPTLRDVTVNGAKQSGIFFDGNVFEAQLFNVRSSQNGDRGFKAAANGAGLPGETRFFGCSFNSNLVGCDLGGGGHFSFHGLTLTTNTNEGLIANGVILEGMDLQLEINGTAAGNQATLTSLTGALLMGVLITTKPAGTGKGLSFVGALWCHVLRFNSDSSVAGGGYLDISFDNTSSRCSVEDYAANDFTDRLSLGTGGGYMVKRGGSWLSSQNHAQQTLSSAVTQSQTFDATKYDSFLSVRTVAAITVTIANPTIGTAFHNGQRVVIQVYNNTAGATTTAFGALFHLAGAFVDPAAGKTRIISFEWDATRNGFFETGRSAADIT